MRSWFLFSSLVLSGLTACRPGPNADSAVANDPAVLMHNDFEASAGWGPSNPTLTTEKAHSGRWSLRTTPEQPFSYTYARALGELSPTPFRKLRLEAQVLRAAEGSTAQLIVQVDASPTDEAKVFYSNLPLATAVTKVNSWTAVHLPITLPTSVQSTNVLKVYLWNDRATAPSYLDDVVLHRVE
jgi:hypothetical protein